MSVNRATSRLYFCVSERRGLGEVHPLAADRAYRDAVLVELLIGFRRWAWILRPPHVWQVGRRSANHAIAELSRPSSRTKSP